MEDSAGVERPFSEEVESVVQGSNGDKAPSPNRFLMAFFQCCWDVVQRDIMGVC